ncbi:MAG: hypothetical protein KC493_06575 [Bacteriovoracaceae bacterium]|nr:hypothetical protein [Bacteriovoracaceae bacterium]
MKFKSTLKYAAILIVVAAFIQLLRYGLRDNSEDIPQIVVSKNEPPKKVTSKLTKKSPIRKKKKIKKKSKSDKSFVRLRKEFKAIQDLLTKEDKKCSVNLEEIVPGEDFIDDEDDMYKNPQVVMEIVSRLGLLMNRPIATRAYENAKEMIHYDEFEESEIDVLQFYSSMATLNTCRDPKILNYLITSLEAAKKYNWKSSDQKTLGKLVLSNVTQDITVIPTALNLSFSMHVINSLLELGYLNESNKDEVQFLMSDVMEHQVNIMERIQPGSDRNKSVQELVFDFDARESAAERLKELILKYYNEM